MKTEVLQLGDAGDLVKQLQEKLKILGFYNAMITGSFGLSTEIGVKAFQKEYGLKETGIADEETLMLLYSLTEDNNDMLRVSLPLSIGATGEDVKELQTKLKVLLYYTGPTNSIFDLETQNAVKRFQLLNDLTTTGTVNSETWSKINELYGTLNSCAKQDDDGDTFLYTVQKGDTLYAIARRYDTTVDELKRLNNLISNTLSIGQVLKIPGYDDISDEYLSYTVQSGDTLYSIASRYDTTVDELKSLNNLTSNILQIGQVLKIPIVSEQPNYFSYQVKQGDTLYSIASRYDTTVNELKSLNNLTSNILQIGQVLRIPIVSEQPNYLSYQVKQGDTLYSIASRYDTTVDKLKSLNNLTSNTLQIGQILKISLF